MEIIQNFNAEILELVKFKDNLVIGGSVALQLHGLILAKDPADLDIILYQPTDDQRQLVETNYEECGDYPDDDKQQNRAWEKELNGYKINIILEEDLELPTGLLTYRGVLLVNRIKDIIRAKANYSAKGNHVRAKDAKDFQNLKALNFNYEL